MYRPSLFPLVATLISGFFLAACVFLLPELAAAGEPSPFSSTAEEEAGSEGKSLPPCSCPESRKKSARPKFAGLSNELDESDERAALESVHQALTKVADGASYVWHRENGRLSGLVQPTSSFRNPTGEICRHIVIMLTTGSKTRKTEGVACRGADGLWKLDG